MIKQFLILVLCCCVYISAFGQVQISNALKAGLNAYQQLHNQGHDKQGILIIVDFTLPSTVPRLFIYDVNKKQVIFKTYVTHGINSGKGIYATNFSNVPGSYESSLGTYLVGSLKQMHSGTNARLLYGQDPTNSNAYARAILLHGANYIGNGKTGHSLGCFAVPMQDLKTVLNLCQPDSVLYAYY